MTYEIVASPTAVEAIKLANRGIDGGRLDIISANGALRQRANERFGSVSGSFTPRVANIWLEGGSGNEYYALVTLAASQDYTYPCETEWPVRKVVTREAIGKYEERELKRYFSIVLKDRYLFNRLARDYNDLPFVLSLAAKNNVAVYVTPPISGLPEDASIAANDAIEDNWLKLKLKKEY